MTPARSADLARALALVRPVSRRRLYWTARAVLVTDRTHVAPFDEVFRSIFGDREREDAFEPDELQTAAAAADERPRVEHRTSPTRRLPATGAMGCHRRVRAPSTSDGSELEVPLALASDEERLARKSFDTLEPAELAQLYRLMSRLELATPTRRTRRYERGAADTASTCAGRCAASLRTAGDPIRLARRRRRVVPRRLVLLCDISGSMEPYTRAYLQFLMAAAGSGPHAEAFVFATRLTRLTRALSSRNPERAIRRARRRRPTGRAGRGSATR